MGRFDNNRPHDGRDARNAGCEIGDFGVHLFDHTAKLEVVSFDHPLIYVRFSANGQPRPMLREELKFEWDKPKPLPEKKKRRERDDEDDDEDDND